MTPRLPSLPARDGFDLYPDARTGIGPARPANAGAGGDERIPRQHRQRLCDLPLGVSLELFAPDREGLEQSDEGDGGPSLRTRYQRSFTSKQFTVDDVDLCSKQGDARTAPHSPAWPPCRNCPTPSRPSPAG